MSRLICVVLAVLLLSTASAAANPRSKATTKAEAPAVQQALVCGQVDSSDPNFTAQQQIRRITGEAPRILVASEFDGLEAGRHLCAGLFTDPAEAERVRVRLAKMGLACEVRPVTPLDFVPRDIRYVGDRTRMWFCFKNRGDELSSDTCMKHFARGRRLHQPTMMKARQGIGYYLQNVVGTEPSGDLCGGQTARYRATRLRHEEHGKAVRDAGELEAIQARTLSFLQKRTGRRFPSLSIVFASQLDLSGDKQPDTLVWATSNDPKTPNPKTDYLSAILVFDANGEAVHELFFHHVPSQDLRGGVPEGLMEGRLLGVLDANGNRRLDVAIEVSFGTSQGLRIVTLASGQIRVMAQDICNR